MSDLIFEELPKPASGPGSGKLWMPELKARPGQWARIPVKRPNSSYYRTQGFEMAVRTVDGERRIYGRYVGMNGEHA